jgi:Glycosyl transferases group 1
MTRNALYFPFFAPPTTGGDFIAIDHIASLNRLGFDAKALYLRNDIGYRQFSVPVASGNIRFNERDIVVIGEVHKQLFDRLYRVNCIKVLHNQNPYYTFMGFDSVQQLNAYPLTHILTTSAYTKKILLGLGVAKPILVVRPFIPSYFAPGEKLLQIAYTTYKRGVEPGFVIGVFRSRYPELEHVPWLELRDMPRPACAAVMAQCAIYAAFPMLEGLGLMSLEAMASGCQVVGYVGAGGIEYATEDNGVWIGEGDHESFALKLKEACDLFLSNGRNRYVEYGISTARRYSQEIFERQIREAYMQIMGSMAEDFRF